jgi:Zn-dependent peptidase ImmA (M78 family)/transcriptional regulator with XRE-family HTH domain
VSAERVWDHRAVADERASEVVGEQVRQARLSLGLTQGDLAREAGLDTTALARVEAGAGGLDEFELVRLSSALGVSTDHLLHPQPDVVTRHSVPLSEDDDSDVTRRSHRLEIVLVEWLREVCRLVDDELLPRRERLRFPGRVSSEPDARRAAGWVRHELDLGDAPIVAILDVCERAGQYTLVTDLPGEGASLVDGDLAVAVVDRHRDPDRRRVAAAHELGHLVVGDPYSNDLGAHASRAEREQLVDVFAAELLLPTPVLTDGPGEVTRQRLVEIVARYRTPWSLALRQAEVAGVLDKDARQEWNRSRPTRAELMEAVEWTPQPDLDGERVPPGYARAVMRALRQDLVTAARAVALLHGQVEEADLPAPGEAKIDP